VHQEIDISEGEQLMTGDASQADDTVVYQTCQRVVHLLTAKYRWTLLSEEKLTALVIDAVQRGHILDNLEPLVTHLYTLALYSACRKKDDLELHERGYTDLFRYLYRAACQRWPDLAEDVTQRALLLVYQQIQRCTNPAAFRSFALFKLLQAAKELRRSAGIDQSLEIISPAALAESDDTLTAALVRQEGTGTLLDALKRLQDAQRHTISLKFFSGLSDDEIAEQLAITAGHVRVLRFRGLEQLRQDPHLREYFERSVSPEPL
jgi:RNA polymerase sigma factor (sigma-70 family)